MNRRFPDNMLSLFPDFWSKSNVKCTSLGLRKRGVLSLVGSMVPPPSPPDIQNTSLGGSVVGWHHSIVRLVVQLPSHTDCQKPLFWGFEKPQNTRSLLATIQFCRASMIKQPHQPLASVSDDRLRYTGYTDRDISGRPQLENTRGGFPHVDFFELSCRARW